MVILPYYTRVAKYIAFFLICTYSNKNNTQEPLKINTPKLFILMG